MGVWVLQHNWTPQFQTGSSGPVWVAHRALKMRLSSHHACLPPHDSSLSLQLTRCCLGDFALVLPLLENHCYQVFASLPSSSLEGLPSQWHYLKLNFFKFYHSPWHVSLLHMLYVLLILFIFSHAKSELPKGQGLLWCLSYDRHLINTLVISVWNMCVCVCVCTRASVSSK